LFDLTSGGKIWLKLSLSLPSIYYVSIVKYLIKNLPLMQR
jgi:hypothetical protein